MSLLPNLDEMTDNEKLAVLESIQKSIAQSKEIQKKKIGENVDLVVQALKKIESDIRDRFDSVGNSIEKRVLSIKDGRDGSNGNDGRNGKDGKSGKDGLKGDRGTDGQAGRDGVDGVDGVSVTNANIDFDGSLVITLSTGVEINVGEVVAPDLAESIKIISNGGGTSQSVIDTLASLQAQITAMAGFVNYEGTWNASTNTPTLTSSVGTKGDYYVVSTTGTTNLNGITTWTQGDWAIFNGSAWEKVDNTDLVTSVAGRTGAITLTTADISGLGTIATQASSNVSITGGSITGITDLAVADGGTGASTAPNARINLGLVIGTDVLAPNGSAAALTSFPTFNQSTTGSAATLTTPRAIYGNNFDGSAALTQVIASTYGGTGNGFTKFTGATTAEKTYTLPDASSTIVVQGGALGTPSSGTVTNLTGTASININGTVGATTATTGAFTTLTASADSTFSSTGALIISKGTTGQRPTAASGMLRFNTTTTEFEGYNGTAWASVGGAALSNDTSTATDVFPLFANATTGTASTLFTGNASLLYKPSTGEFKARVPVASNGIVVNSQTVATSYTIAAGFSAMSAGPITLSGGAVVTLSSGSRWVIQ